nr:hypothetical protein [Tanacetum cinerariifolium]
MAPLTFADTNNMVAFLSKSDASVGFDQIVDFLNGHVIQYALMVNPTIYVSCIKQLWATVSIKKANDVVKLRALIDGNQIVDFLNGHVIQYALMVNPTIYVSCIKQLWATVLIKKANDVVKLRALIDGNQVIVT